MPFIPMMIVVAISGQAAPQMRRTEPIVQVGVYSYKADGSIGARAFGTPPLDSVVWTSDSLCRVGAGRSLTDTSPAHAWKFSGTIVSQSADEAVVQLDWQRTYEHGHSISGRGGSVQLTLRRGEPVPLDFASPTASTCGVASVGFEARYEPQFGPPFAGRGVGGGIGAGAGSGSGSGSGGGARVTGSITENGRQLAFTTNRVVAFTPTAASPPRTTVASSKGEGKTVDDMPGRDDVLEFGLPPFAIGVGPGGPDKFAIRVRIRPGQ